MEKTYIDGAGEFYSYYPELVVVVTARYDDRENAMTATWHSPISFSPALYGIFISPKRFTHQLITGSREFCLNFITFEKAEIAARIGGVKGAKIDKLSLLNIKTEKGVKVGAPILKDAYVSLECRVTDRRPYGDHDLFVGEVLITHFIKDLFSLQGIIDFKKVTPALYAGADNYMSVDPGTLQFIDRAVKAEPSDKT